MVPVAIIGSKLYMGLVTLGEERRGKIAGPGSERIIKSKCLRWASHWRPLGLLGERALGRYAGRQPITIRVRLDQSLIIVLAGNCTANRWTIHSEVREYERKI